MPAAVTPMLNYYQNNVLLLMFYRISDVLS